MYSPKLNHDYNSIKPSSVTQPKEGFVDYAHFDQSRPQRPINPTFFLKKATIDYLRVIKAINPAFRTEEIFIPKRTLTNPREPSKNSGYDNINDDYILRVNDTLGDLEKYQILDLMGQGSFGQVVKCRTVKTGELVAIKVIKRQFMYLKQGQKEIDILHKFKGRPEKNRFLQLHDSFTFRGHTCAVFELLSISLHRLFSQQPGRPNMAIIDIQKISVNILETLALLKDMKIIHTDLKPDNILLKSTDTVDDVKLIDYGSAFLESDKPNYCIQTAFYRSPEVILRMKFGCAIDMWSFGCFVTELFIGKPLFPSGNEATLLHMMVATLKCLPPDHMLRTAPRSSKFFHIAKSPNDQTKLRDIVSNPHDMPISNKSIDEMIKEVLPDNSEDSSDNQDLENLCDFIKKILVFDPLVRYTPQEALKHKFITSIAGKTSRHSTQMQSTQRPLQPKASKSTSNLTTSMIYASLAKASNSASSLTTPHTTENSLEIDTSINHQSQKIQKSDSISHLSNNITPVSPVINNKHAMIKPSPSSTVTSPTNKPLKSILKKQPSQSHVNPIIINSGNTKQSILTSENTLDSRVASLFQPCPAYITLSSANHPSASTAVSPNNPATGSIPLENGIRVSLNDLLAAQNYPQQQQFLYNNTLSPNNYQPFLSPSLSASTFQSPLNVMNMQTTMSQHPSAIHYPTNFQQPLYQTTTVPNTTSINNTSLIYQHQHQPNQILYQPSTYPYQAQLQLQQRQQKSPLLLYPGVNSYSGVL